MFTRSHAVLSATSSSLASLQLSTAQLSTTSCHTIRERCCCSHRRPQKRRRYASVASPDSSSRRDHNINPREHVWPDPPSGHSCPTPYQIFAMTPNQTYSKTTFYHLVKLYHPDRFESSPPHMALPLHVRLERYRLIVAAHNILSDPSKRSAYDKFGLGWHRDRGASTLDPGPFTHNDANDPIWTNATWEDWERFYERKEYEERGESKPAEPYYMSNTSFFLLVLALVSAGSTYNLNRAKGNAQFFVDQRDIIHDRAAKELRRVRHDKEAMGDRNDRVQWFVRQREASLGLPGSDPAVLREEMADRALPNREVCRSEQIAQEDSSSTER